MPTDITTDLCLKKERKVEGGVEEREEPPIQEKQGLNLVSTVRLTAAIILLVLLLDSLSTDPRKSVCVWCVCVCVCVWNTL